MEDFVAYPSRWRIGLLILGAFAFVAAGLWMIGAFGPPPLSHRYPPEIIFLAGWSSVVFFGLCGLAGVKHLFETGEEVRIGKSGIRFARWSDETIPWSEINDVTVWAVRRQRFIVLHLRDPARFPGKGWLGRRAVANRALTGGDISISLATANRSFDDAMAAIEQFRLRTLR